MKAVLPKEENLLWHYCTPETFLAICQNKTVRFSSLQNMNDSMELSWGRLMFEELLKKSSKPDDRLELLQKVIIPYLYQYQYLGCCFSMESDLLSQWRGYADNGVGYSIGFSKAGLIDHLSHLPSFEVVYDKEVQEKLMLAKIEYITTHQMAGNEEGLNVLKDIIEQMAYYKNPAFSEEREFRFLIPMYLNMKTLYDGKYEVNSNHMKGIVGEGIRFSDKNGIPTPYMDMKLPDGDNLLIKKIAIGPKSRASKNEIQFFLNTIGLNGVTIEKSKASYR